MPAIRGFFLLEKAAKVGKMAEKEGVGLENSPPFAKG
jgi:hypothetical protein